MRTLSYKPWSFRRVQDTECCPITPNSTTNCNGNAWKPPDRQSTFDRARDTMAWTSFLSGIPASGSWRSSALTNERNLSYRKAWYAMLQKPNSLTDTPKFISIRCLPPNLYPSTERQPFPNVPNRPLSSSHHTHHETHTLHAPAPYSVPSSPHSSSTAPSAHPPPASPSSPPPSHPPPETASR